MSRMSVPFQVSGGFRRLRLGAPVAEPCLHRPAGDRQRSTRLVLAWVLAVVLPLALASHVGPVAPVCKAVATRTRLQLRGGGWLGDSSESAGDGNRAEVPIALACSSDSSEDEGSIAAPMPRCKYNLTDTGLLDPAQYNVTDDELDLFLRPPPQPTMRDGKPLCGVGILLSLSKPHKVDFIKPGSPADLSGKIFVGDEVISMDGKSLADLPWEQIRDLGLGHQDTVLTLEIIPAESKRADRRLWGTRGSSDRSALPSFALELKRAPDHLPVWARPAADDPGGEGPEAQAWKNKTRQELREMLVGFPLADAGNWVKMKDRVGMCRVKLSMNCVE